MEVVQFESQIQILLHICFVVTRLYLQMSQMTVAYIQYVNVKERETH